MVRYARLKKLKAYSMVRNIGSARYIMEEIRKEMNKNGIISVGKLKPRETEGKVLQEKLRN
jgi:hypothetical protein